LEKEKTVFSVRDAIAESIETVCLSFSFMRI